MTPRLGQRSDATWITLHALIDRGELAAEVTRPDDRPRRRRKIRIRRQAVDDYLERARV